MAEILPDGTFQNYFRKCHVCGKTIETNIQGDELRSHTCGKPDNKSENNLKKIANNFFYSKLFYILIIL